MSDQWIGPDQPHSDDGWVGPDDHADTASFSGPDGIAVAKTVYPSLGPILHAFGHGAKEGWGDEPLGLSPEAIEWLSKKGIFGPEKGGYDNPFQAFNEMLAHTVVGAAQIVGRSTSAAFGAYQAGMAETGEQIGDPKLGRDLAAMPEAFFGSPHPMGIPKSFPMGSVFREVPRELENPTIGFHGSTDVIGEFDPEKTRLHRGVFFAENPNLASKFAEGRATDSDPSRIYGEDIPEEIKRWVQEHAGETEAKRIGSLVDEAEGLENGSERKDELNRTVNDELRKLTGLSQEYGPSSPNVTRARIDLGKSYEVDLGGKFDWDKEREAINYAKSNGYDSVTFKNSGEEGNFYSIFDPERINPHPWGEPGSLPPVMTAAKDLGVIGPPKPDLTDMAPAARAAAEVPPPKTMAAARSGDSISEPVGGPEKAGNIRLDQIGINKDAHEVILDAAKKYDDFDQARQGNVPLSQIESLSQASGIPSKVLTENDGLGRLMHNDAVVRTWLEAFGQGTDDIAAQAAKVRETGDEADVATLREMRLKFDHMAQQVSGLTAESGRTLRVFRDFYESRQKAEALGKLLDENPGNDLDSMKKLADAMGGLDDPAQVARLLNDSRQPTFWDKYLYYWVNALISGPVTHIKYIGANAAFGAYEAGVVTPIAGALGAARRLAGGTDGVYAGEAAARVWGLLAGTPDALKASWEAAKNNVMTPFPNEVAGAAVNPLTQTRPSPIGGKLGFAIGIPGRSAAGIHSFFRWAGYRAEIEAQAYRQTAKEGLSPASQAFWERRATLADTPTESMMNAGIENGNHLTFISEQGEFGKAVSRLANTRFGESGIQPFKLILPFTHIPGQILRAGLEQTPAAFLDSKMRADILGKNGAVAADTARARLVAGGAVSGMVANWAVNDTLTGYGPTDQTERAQWLRTHEPYSVRLGGWWYSYNKFGPIGDLIGLVSNLVEVGPKVKEGEYAEAAGRVMKATSHILEDEVGMQGLVNLIDALNDPDRKMARFVSSQAASNLPYSSLIRQTASITDPTMREAKTFVDQLRYNIPYARQDLLPKRDWLGQPMTNPGYGNIIRQREVNADPIDLAVSELRGFRPAPPQARIGGVALPPKLYDEYQATAGGMTRAALEHVVTAPGWGEIPPGIREHIVHNMVENARKTSGSMMQARHPELILQGISDRQDKINGVKPAKLKE